jgi:hypothetical protein
LSKTYGLRTSRIAIVTAGLAVLLILVGICGAAAASDTGLKGSSCAHPYKVQLTGPAGAPAPPNSRGFELDGMYGALTSSPSILGSDQQATN